MSFHHLLSKRFMNTTPEASELSEEAQIKLKNCIDTSLWPDDFIEVDGKMISIYNQEVTVDSIFEYFKERAPWLRWELKKEDLDKLKPIDVLAMKYVCFNRLVDMLVDSRAKLTEAFTHVPVLNEQTAQTVH